MARRNTSMFMLMLLFFCFILFGFLALNIMQAGADEYAPDENISPDEYTAYNNSSGYVAQIPSMFSYIALALIILSGLAGLLWLYKLIKRGRGAF